MPPSQAEFGTPIRQTGRHFLWTLVLIGLCCAGAAALAAASLGPLAGHMSAHILLMNAIAPAIAVAGCEWPRIAALYRRAAGSLVPASAMQVAALWVAHSPPMMAASLGNQMLHVAIQSALLLAALWFWFAVLAQRGAARWRAIVALLATGKLFCLLAALLVFAPRALYPHVVHHAHLAAADPLADQYLAGLLMLVVCPLTYVLAGVVIAERWLRELRGDDVSSSLPIR